MLPSSAQATPPRVALGARPAEPPCARWFPSASLALDMADVASHRTTLPKGFEDVLAFPLSAALLGRRARRFSLGATIPDGPLAYDSRREPLPLTELEQMLVLTAAGGNTGWHYAITHNERYAPHFPNYAGAAGGRTFPSAAGFTRRSSSSPTTTASTSSRRATRRPWWTGLRRITRRRRGARRAPREDQEALRRTHEHPRRRALQG